MTIGTWALQGAVLSAAVLAGCAVAPPVDEPELYAAGWRRAIVEDVGTGESLITPERGLCIGSHRWQPGESAAAVRYISGGRFHRGRTTTIVATALVVRPDDSLYVNLDDCRLERQLPPTSGSP